MSKEYEVQVIDVDIVEMRKKLKKIGGKKVHSEQKLVRAAFKLCNSDNGFVRVRFEGDKKTKMTVKTYTNPKFPIENEITIKEGFEEGKAFLQSLNLDLKAFQETYREKWSLPIDNVHEITFDTWPGLPQWMEIDCTKERTMNEVIKKLGIPKEKISYGPVSVRYELYYGIQPKIINEMTPSLTFKNIHREIKPKKNIDLFKKTIEQQKKKYLKN